MSELQLVVLLSLACYRVTRLVVKDTIIDGFRIWLHTAILGRKPRLWREKLQELVSCPFCISVWIAGALTLLADHYVGSLPLPFAVWGAVAAGSLVAWRIIEE